MKVILTEKPSVAKDIALFLGAKSRQDGYFEGNGFRVTWAFGHLVTLKDPHEYDPSLKKWTLSTLPIVPQKFELKLIDNPGVSKQFGVIKRLFQSAEEIIAATDAGREGELIFRYILSLLGKENISFKRLWLTSLTDEAIKKAFDALKPGSEYNHLYAAAKCRSESDWIVGLNATRNFTVRYGFGEILWTLGRVQTPVLALIAEKDEEIRNFVSKAFWELKTKYREILFKCKKERFATQEEAQEALSSVQNHPFAIEQIESKQEKVFPPLLYDLTDLQRDMNRRYGLSASETLNIAQELYEAKLISYPRTDSKFLGSDMKAEVSKALCALKPLRQVEIERLDLQNLPFHNKIINDAKTGEHHAIIPTGKVPGPLSASSQKVFHAILTRLIAVFYPPCLKDITTIHGSANQVAFFTKGVHIVEAGWTLLHTKEGDEDKPKEEEQELPAFTVGESGPHEPLVKQGKTEPPKHFTENSLLGAMETAGKWIEDELLREALKQKGLGTPATRAAIIETLLKRNYVIREKKNLKVTDLGRHLIALIRDPLLKSPELTGEWEAKLKAIEQGTLDPSIFMQEIVAYTKTLIEEKKEEQHFLGACPLCKKPVIQGQRGVGCSGWKEGCSFVLWKEYKGVPLSVDQLRLLIQKGVLPYPITLPTGKVILCLSKQGTLIEIPYTGQKTAPPAPSPSKKPKGKRKTHTKSQI